MSLLQLASDVDDVFVRADENMLSLFVQGMMALILVVVKIRLLVQIILIGLFNI